MSAPEAKRRMLLVDDEQKIVDGLQRRLRPQRATWEVATATSGSAALAALEAAPFDVIVTDMRMPEMDGASLLAVVRARHPATMRLVLSGQTDAEAALRAVPVAHQFLSKPTDPVVLLESLNRVALSRDAVADARAVAAVGAVHALPTPPAILDELTQLVNRDGASASAIAAVVERDPAIFLKLLQLVNSAFFGHRREMYRVVDAVSYLGVGLLKNLIDSASILNPGPVAAKRFDALASGQRSRAVAEAARHVGGERGEIYFAAGMLHDVGKLIMASEMPDVYDEVAQRAEASGRSFEEEEERRGGCRHAHVGAYLLDLWGMPQPLVEALAIPPGGRLPSLVAQADEILRRS